MSNTLTIEAQLMYDDIKDIDDPKEALEKLATLEPQMGWGIHPERVRAVAYGIWLNEKRPDWYPFYEKMILFFSAVSKGDTVGTLFSCDEMPEAPEGWIPPMEYLKGGVVE